MQGFESLILLSIIAEWRSWHLVGINFDRNWEGVGGDIQYLPSYQRSIICDIRYVLLLIDQLGECPRLIDELSLVSRR